MKPGDAIVLSSPTKYAGKSARVDSVKEGHFGRRWLNVRIAEHGLAGLEPAEGDLELTIRESDADPSPVPVARFTVDTSGFNEAVESVANGIAARTEAGRRYWRDRER